MEHIGRKIMWLVAIILALVASMVIALGWLGQPSNALIMGMVWLVLANVWIVRSKIEIEKMEKKD